MPQPKELVAASATPIILSILNDGENYGYEIIRTLKNLSDSEIQWTDGMLYPVLRRLEKNGHVRSKWRVSESGKKRRYYRLAKSGIAHLQEYKKQWVITNRVLDELWGGVACSI